MTVINSENIAEGQADSAADGGAGTSQDEHQEVKTQAEEAADLAMSKVLDELVDPNYRWYIVSVYAGMEDSVRLSLMERIKRAGLEDSFNQIIIPKIKVEKNLKSGTKIVEKTSFPGYMFVQADLTEAALSTVVSTPRVSGFLGFHKRPKPMTDKDVIHFLGPNTEDEKAPEEKAASEVIFRVNQAIKVTGGPFANFDGIVEEVKPDKMKLTVLVSILGRETPVELSYDQVQKID